MTDTLEEFIQKVTDSNENFTLTYNDNYDEISYHFIQANVGKAKCIYGIENEGGDRFLSIRGNLELVAVVTEDGSIHFNEDNEVGNDLCGRYDGLGLQYLRRRITTEVGNIFKELCDNTPYLPDDGEIASIKKRAYSFAESCKKRDETITFVRNPREITPIDMKLDEVLYIVCGYETPAQHVAKYVKDFPFTVSSYQEKQAYYKAVNEYLKDPNLLTDKKKVKSDYERD
jgi:hypothetical protein